MTVVADISVSLDGFVTGPDPGPAAGLGTGGEALHVWALNPDDVDAELLRTGTARSGAVVMGRRLFDIVDAPDGWNDEMGYGATEVGTPSFVVLTHEPPDDVRLALDFTFVTEGVEAAVEADRARACDRDVVVMGGGDVVRQVLEAGLAEELVIHLAPVVLGGGTPLFGDRRVDLEQVSSVASRNATHLTYRVL